MNMYDVADGLKFMPNCLADENKYSIRHLTTFIILWEYDHCRRLDSKLWTLLSALLITIYSINKYLII